MPVWCHPTPPPCLTPLTSNLLDTVGWAENKLGCSKNTAPLSPIFAAEAKVQQGSIEGNPSACKFHVSHYKHAKGCMQGRRTFKKLHPGALENHVLYFFNTSCFVGGLSSISLCSFTCCTYGSGVWFPMVPSIPGMPRYNFQSFFSSLGSVSLPSSARTAPGWAESKGKELGAVCCFQRFHKSQAQPQLCLPHSGFPAVPFLKEGRYP